MKRAAIASLTIAALAAGGCASKPKPQYVEPKPVRGEAVIIIHVRPEAKERGNAK